MNKHSQLISGNDFPISPHKVEAIKSVATQAIITSVVASPTEKEDIIANTHSHIDKSFCDKKAIFLAYLQESEVLGFIIIQDYWNLSDLFVAPNVHRQGIGHALWNTAKQRCVTSGNSNGIRVNSSLNAEGFYRKLGFIDFKPEKSYPKIIVPLIYHFPTANSHPH